MTAVEDCWDVFGSDDDDDDDDEEQEKSGATSRESSSATSAPKIILATIAAHLAQEFVKANSQIRLSDRVVGVIEMGDDFAITLEQRGMTVVRGDDPSSTTDKALPPLDAMVILHQQESEGNPMVCPPALLPGGLLITNQESMYDKQNFLEPTSIYESSSSDTKYFRLIECVKRPIRVHTSKCLWLPPSHSISDEAKLLQSATIALSAHEISTGLLTDMTIQRAVKCLNEHGYCVVRGLLDSDECAMWGQTVLESVHSAAKILLERDQVDIYHPHTSKCEPQAYRELSMREDLRLDLRHGPELSSLRARDANKSKNKNKNNNDDTTTNNKDKDKERGNGPMVISGQTASFDGFLRGNANLLEILRRTMNPKKEELFQGNLGRYNFGGSGADGSYQDLRVSPVGGIVTFGGCGDQSIHADTPHLFEHIPDLPAHYINIFGAGTPFEDKVGGTAFVHGSHNLAFTAKHCGSANEGYQAVYPYLVRPCLDLGDVVLFDCRILHFGMSNTSQSTERVLLYTNATQAWFHDPKNWDDRRPIFDAAPTSNNE